MLILIRWLVMKFKSEHEVLARYERSHPHFLRYLALDALLSVALVFAGFQIYAAHSSTSKNLTHAGQIALSSPDLIDHLKGDRIRAYWLGAVRGDEYTVNHEVAGIVDIFYLPAGAVPSDHRAFTYEIKTYKDQGVWDAHTHTSKATTNIQVISVNKSTSIRINPTSMKGVIATFSDRPEILAIAYPKPQSLQAMIKNVESLKLVQ